MSILVGIEDISFYTSKVFFDLRKLALQKNIDSKKYTKGLGQEKMSIITQDEDVITLAFNAITNVIKSLSEKEREQIGLLLFSTESNIDNSKACAVILHNLLGLDKTCRCLDIKQACYGGTGALFFADCFIQTHKDKKALIVMSDIAYYGIDTNGEPTQGCGATAVLLSTQPKIAVLNYDNVVETKNNNDFYRPVYCDKPIYDGHMSIRCYLSMFEDVFYKYQQNSSFDYLITHSPFTRMLDKCCKIANINESFNENETIKQYNKIIGNTYTASLYISLISLLENSNRDLSNKNIALFSYGSGSVCEIFSIKILDGYKNFLHHKEHLKLLNNRIELNYEQYCQYLNSFEARENQLNWERQGRKNTQSSTIQLEKIVNGIRCYSKD